MWAEPGTNKISDSYIVRVKAVVMTRDESSGGWLAQEGCLSRVGVSRLLPAGLLGRNTFLIHGERLKDKQVILECVLKKDLVYTKATPTFHHWRVDNRKCGLTFQSPSDARAFDRGVRKALEDLTDGRSLSETCSSVDPVVCLQAPPRPRPRCRTKTDVLNALSVSPQAVRVFPRHVGFQVEEEIVRINPRERTWLTGYEDYRHANSRRDKLPQPNNPDAYVHFTKSEPPKHNPVVMLQPKVKRWKEDGERLRCVYCQDVFNHEDNGRGRCQEAPDPVQTCIRRVSFMWCADSLLYHCMSDPEGDYSDPCSCDTGDERFCLRWMALVGLSLLAPCMCCYAPLRACHRCGVACHCCGGKHKAVG
uniref:Sprouty-related, EVH1 domain-containing protein 2 n=1 Tax=Scophthalmus maximus TaxID=52904 RepID=A0A8D3CV71_SCOMX